MNDNAAGELEGLEALLERAGVGSHGHQKNKLPPVDKWNPDFSGELDMRIKSDGSWFYRGSVIRRLPFVKLFSTILRKDDDGHTYLVTPIEKYRITVDDAHFNAVEMNRIDNNGKRTITIRTNVGDVVEAGNDNPLRFVAESNGGLKPYISVRGRLDALFTRATMYELIECGEEIETDSEMMFAIRSNDCIFPIMPLAELNRLSV